MGEIIYLTQDRFNNLKEELERLKTVGRQEVARKLKQAKELGDLSENSEYQEAREEQRRIEQRINQLEMILKNAVLIKKVSHSQTVRIGSVVKVKKEGEKNPTVFTIVGSDEAQPQKGLISNESPLGKGLLGKKEGDLVKIKTPKGEISYQIISIE